jgi:magnesium-transporting ATPase (P-type)
LRSYFAADARIISGDVLLDRSMLTGESVPVETTAGTQAYAGALIGVAVLRRDPAPFTARKRMPARGPIRSCRRGLASSAV